VLQPGAREQSQRQQAGFTRLWPVGTAYEIRAGRLYEVDPVVRRIAPAGSPQIVTDLSRLYEGDEAAVLGFARTWGLLGWWPLQRQALHGQPRQLLATMERARLSPEDPRIGEPLAWIWAHASGVRLCLTLLGYIRQGDGAGLGNYLQSLAVPLPSADGNGLTVAFFDEPAGEPIAETGSWPRIICGTRHEISSRQFMTGHPEDPLGWGLHIVTQLVNANLTGGISEQLLVEPVQGRHRARRERVFASLADVAYWHLAELCLALDQLVPCAECGTVFVREDRRQRFCPPPRWQTPEGELRGPGESLCAKRARMRRLRKRE
jgi:hypothetical protein